MTKAEIISELRGTAKYDIPESLLGYEGKVTGYVYLEFEDGSHTDEGRFIFNIKRSMISDVLPEAGDKYVQDFEDVKERVEQAGDSATKDIEKAKDDAESQIGEYVGEVESAKDSTIEDIDKALPEVVESAKQDISSSASDVHSKASEANEDISNLIKSTEDARDEAVKTMNELDYSNRNLLLDSDVPVKTDAYRMARYYLTEKLILGERYTLTVKGVLSEAKQGFGVWIGDAKVPSKAGVSKDIGDGIHKLTFTAKEANINKDKLLIYNYPKDESGDSSIEWVKLNHGTLTMPWTPAPEDIGTKSELEKIKQAIINLGGSI